MGETHFKLMEWRRRQPLTKEAAVKSAPQTRAFQKLFRNGANGRRNDTVELYSR
jgi:hypothetical protein